MKSLNQPAFLVGQVRVPEIGDEHDTSTIADVPHFMQKRVIKDKTLAFAPSQSLLIHL